MEPRRIGSIAMLLAAVAVAPACSQADDTNPRAAMPARVSNRAIVAAMPEGVTSILIWRYDALLRLPEHSAFRVFARGLLGFENPEADPHQTALMGGRSMAEAGIVGMALGGSDFKGPAPGEMTGTFTPRLVWIYREPVEGLEARLRDLVEVTVHEEGEVKLFEIDAKAFGNLRGPPEQSGKAVIGAAGRIVVVAGDSAETVAMVRSLARDRTELPARWRELARDVDLEAPMLILRRYEPENAGDPLSPMSPSFPAGQRADIEGCGLSLRLAAPPALDLRCHAKDRARAMEYLGRMVHVPSELWDVKPVEGGFVADVPLEQMPASHLYGISWIVFGLFYSV